jgi:hypothetical protein
VVTSSGLFRSANPTFSRWEQMNQVKGITVISPNPQVSNNLLHATNNGIFAVWMVVLRQTVSQAVN